MSLTCVFSSKYETSYINIKHAIFLVTKSVIFKKIYELPISLETLLPNGILVTSKTSE